MADNYCKFTVLMLFCFLFLTPAGAQAQINDSRVWNVKISGNHTFDDMVIKNRISNEGPSFLKKMIFWKKTGMRFKEDEVLRDVIRIERFYQRRGFNDVIVNFKIETANKEWKKVIHFEIVENPPIRITSVQHSIQAAPKDSVFILENEKYQRVLNRIPHKENRRYAPIVNEEVAANLVDALKNLGYAYAQTEIIADVDSAQKTAELEIISHPGPRARFDSIIVTGEKNLHQKYIKRETGIEPGSFYNEDDLRQAQREVFNHHLLRFALVSIPEQEKDTTINVLIRVRENKPRAFELLFGIGNVSRVDEWGDFYKLFRSQIGWTHRNVRGRGERFRIFGRVSAIEQQISSQYTFPYLFNTKSSIILNPFLQHKLEPAYEILRWGVQNSFTYQYSQNLTGSVSYQFSINDETTANDNVSLPDSILSYNISSFQINGYYARGFRDGRRGWMLRPSWELSGLFGETTFNFQKTSLDVRKFTKITDEVVFAKRVYFSGIYFSKQDSLPADIRIYNGGTNAVRGWNRLELGPKRPLFDNEGNFSRYAPIGGRATFNFNAELRIELNNLIKGIGIATFLDGGQVWNNFTDIGTTELQYGLGGGLRYRSPIGPIRIDLAYKLNPTNEDLNIYNGRNYGSAWDRWGIHLSIGQAF